MIKSSIIAERNGKELHSYDGYDDAPVLVTTTHGANDGTFVTATRKSAGTTAIIAARGDNGIFLTDLILTTDKVNLATASVIITDGSNVETLIAATVTDAPCNIALSFAGKWATWKECSIDFVTTGAVSATLALGYFRKSGEKTLPYAAWNAKI